MSKEERNTYKIESDENLGEVQIADEVVAIIAGLAAMEVEGVSSMAGNATRELIAKLGMKSLSILVDATHLRYQHPNRHTSCLDALRKLLAFCMDVGPQS